VIDCRHSDDDQFGIGITSRVDNTNEKLEIADAFKESEDTPQGTLGAG
jgi:hypothetical protein